MMGRDFKSRPTDSEDRTYTTYRTHRTSVSGRIVMRLALITAWLVPCFLLCMSGSWALAAASGTADFRSLRTLYVSQKPISGIETSLQFRTISDAAKAVEPGDLVLIHGGVYREAVRIDRSGTEDRPIVFRAATLERVVVTGADLITDWTVEPGASGIYSTPWPYSFIGESDGYVRGAAAPVGRCEQVIVNGYMLHQSLSREQLSYESFFADIPNKRLYIALSGGSGLEHISHNKVEASTRETVWDVYGNYVKTQGITFRYAANRAQYGMVTVYGQNDVIEDCVMMRSNGVGLTVLGKDATIRDCEIRENGQMGIGGSGTSNMLFTGCLVSGNNTKNFPRAWEAGGCKITMTKGIVFDKCRFIGNRGSGLWFDIADEDVEVKNCLFADNEYGGIFYEICYGLHAHDNVIVRNGFEDTYGSWGVMAGIALSSSPGCVIERNLLVGNGEGFGYREQGRTTPRIGKSGPEEPVWNHDNTIRNNILAYNNTQTWGWFDTGDGRNWPRSMGKSKKMSLEDLKLNHHDNVFWASPGQALFNWSPAWSDMVSYSDAASVRKGLGLERGSVVEQVRFKDPAKMDFRLIAPTPAQLRCYPRGDVPGVTLGRTK